MDIDNQPFHKPDLQPTQGTGCYESIKAAVKLQKVYRSYRTRRKLADSAIVAEELWWQAIEYARLNHTTTAFFNHFQPEKTASRWTRVSWNASKVGKGLVEDAKARKLAFQHWIEAIDPRHRYGHNLNAYFDEWYRRNTGQPFFYWLDVGDGRELDLEECPKSRLREERIKYLGPRERGQYEYVIVKGDMIHKHTGYLLDTNNEVTGSKWIFVMSPSQKLYAGEKKKGKFHHSSFLAGGATLAAGRLEAEQGKLKSVSPYSGHYRPTEENLSIFLAFLQKKGVDIEEVQAGNFKHMTSQRYDMDNLGSICNNGSQTESQKAKLQVASEIQLKQCTVSEEEAQCHEKNLLIVPRQKMRFLESEIPHRIDSSKDDELYESEHHLMFKWKAGSRLGQFADNFHKLREHCVEFVHISEQGLPGSSATEFCSQ